MPSPVKVTPLVSYIARPTTLNGQACRGHLSTLSTSGVMVTAVNRTVYLLIVYRPPGSSRNEVTSTWLL